MNNIIQNDFRFSSLNLMDVCISLRAGMASPFAKPFLLFSLTAEVALFFRTKKSYYDGTSSSTMYINILGQCKKWVTHYLNDDDFVHLTLQMMCTCHKQRKPHLLLYKTAPFNSLKVFFIYLKSVRVTASWRANITVLFPTYCCIHNAWCLHVIFLWKSFFSQDRFSRRHALSNTNPETMATFPRIAPPKRNIPL